MSVLSSVYQFGCDTVLQDQRLSVVASAKAHFVQFLSNFLQGPDCDLFKYNQRVRESVGKVVNLAESEFSGPIECSFQPEFGCAIVALRFLGSYQASSYRLWLISLDGWSKALSNCSQLAPGLYVPSISATTGEYDAHFIGTVASSDIKEYWSAFQSILSNLINNASQMKKPQKLHHTPGFILAVATRALSLKPLDDTESVEPRGGFTDVGLHTGCHRRNTAWPLVQAFFCFLLTQADLGVPVCRPEEMAALLALFDLWNAESLVAAVSSLAASDIDKVMTVLRSAVGRAAPYIDQVKHRLVCWSALERRCRDLRRSLEASVARSAVLLTQQYTWSAPTPSFAYAHRTTAPLVMTNDAWAVKARLAVSLEEMRSAAVRNLASITILANVPQRSLVELLQWMKVTGSESASKQVLVINTVDRWLYARMSLRSVRSVCIDVEYPERISVLVESYRRIMLKLTPNLRTQSYGRLRSELRSRELLAVWICFCLIDGAARLVHPIVATRNVCLKWQDLDMCLYLVDNPAIEAAKAVCHYLKSRTVAARPTLFNLSAQNATFAFAVEFGRSDLELQRVLAFEQGTAVERVQVHWQDVQTKKIKAEGIKEEITNYKARLRTAEADRDTAAPSSYRGKVDVINKLTGAISLKENELAEVEKAPPAVVQALPENADKALQWLFFLHPPPHLAALARMGIMAQQMLLPRTFADWKMDEADFRKKISIPDYKLDLDGHYRGKTWFLGNRPALRVLLRSYDSVPQELPPKTIYECTDATKGIWYPDSLTPQFAWNGGGFELDKFQVPTQCWNPFSLSTADLKYIAHELTERLPDPKLQVFMPQLGFERTATTRSNVGIANPAGYMVTEWMNLTAYRAFDAMRAYPLKQLRHLVLALQDKSLPLDQLSVHMLLRQVLYQVGPIEGNCLLWKVDFEGEWLEKLLTVLNVLADELVSTPKNHFHMRIVAEIAAYISQWSQAARECARKLSQIAFKWAQDISVTEAATTATSLQLRAKQCLFYMYSLCAHSHGELTRADAAHMCMLVVLIQNIRVFEDSTRYDAQLRQLGEVQRHIMTSRFHEIESFILGDVSMLTLAVAAVKTSTPSALAWTQLSNQCSFEAQTVDGQHLYSVNVITGTFLYDGNPLRRLPQSILDSPLYKRSFADSNFEVTVDGDSGAMTTMRADAGCEYTFVQLAGDGVLVTERDFHTDQVWKLLDSLSMVTWAAEFPIRLREMHSHWQSADGAWIVFRPLTYREKGVHFLYCTASLKCYRIPQHLEDRSPSDLFSMIGTCDTLVNLTCCTDTVVAKLLSKFESQKFIHVYKPPHGFLRVHLPRFGLEFDVDEDGVILSREFRVFCLCYKQQFPDTLLGFTEYLMLSSGDETKLLVPKQTQLLLRTTVDCVSAQRSFYVYNVHGRLGDLCSTSIAARLYLAALFAASGSLLPEGRTGMTGDETALRLVRESWVNRPLDAEETLNLHLVAQHASRNSGLHLLCHELYLSSQQLNFLHGFEQDKHDDSDSLAILDSHAAADYIGTSASRSWRCRLTRQEERRILALTDRQWYSGLEHGDSEDEADYRTQEYTTCPAVLKRGIVEDMERKLKLLVKLTEPGGIANQTFPLDPTALVQDKITDVTIAELRESYCAHCKVPVESIAHHSQGVLAKLFCATLSEVSNLRIALESHLLADLHSVELPSKTISQTLRLSRIVNTAPSNVTASDLLRVAAEPLYLSSINPVYTAAAIRAIRQDIVLWLKLCVLEDKLTRLVRNSEAHSYNESLLIQDLLCERTYDADQYVEWLVFEVEGRLQIRPAQHTVATAIMENKGAIVQLNMGEGKTRVILPMLILYWGAHCSDRVIRLHFLTQLLDDGYAHFHEYLCASALNRKLFVMPFNRDVEMTTKRAEVLRATLEFCRESKGCVLVAPEHRLSLYLKKFELEMSPKEDRKSICEAIDRIHELKYIDMLDESDEELRHKYQLIYAVGHQFPLKAGDSRWDMVFAVCAAIATNEAVKKTLARPNVSTCNRCDRCCPHAVFPSVRLLPGNGLDNAADALCVTIADAVLRQQLYQFHWMSDDAVRQYWPQMVLFVTDSAYSEEQLAVAVAKTPGVLSEKRMDDLLALRGLLAYRMLFVALEKRHRVNYGVKRSAGSKRIAVPFKASDTPSERSEFNHPDMAVLVTVLSYYYDGLDEAQVREAFLTMLGLNASAQQYLYASWISLIEVPVLIDSVNKLDLSNEVQMQMLAELFSHNRETINFWLHTCVLPDETKQFGEKLIANAWHIADNSDSFCMGFAGTDDTSHLLPLQVHKHHCNDLKLSATNGLMLARLLSEDAQFSSHTVASVDALLDLTVRDRHRALIDVGALCTGSSNLQVANKLLAELEKVADPAERLRGVVFFDDVRKKWCTKDFVGCVTPLAQSNLHERDCLVFFDESRCRGADMKLLPTAHALLTLGLKMCKDKLMQAVGRLRQFGKGQKVTVVAAEDVTQQLLTLNRLTHTSTIAMRHVLLWVLSNTVQATKAGMVEWAYQGLYYCTTRGNSELVCLEEKSRLQDYYCEAQTPKSVTATVSRLHEHFMQRMGTQVLTALSIELMHAITAHVELYGADVTVVGNSCEEEAEKQLEKETEKEMESELERPSTTALDEKDWDYSLLFSVDSTFQGLMKSGAGGVMSSTEFIGHHLSPDLGLHHVFWFPANIYCTANYAFAIPESRDMEEYLRSTDVCIHFAAEDVVLLLSDRESDALLKLLHEKNRLGESFPFKFLHLSEIRRVAKLARSTESIGVSARTAFMLMLFEGDTSFPAGSVAAQEMESVLKGNFAAQRAAVKIPAFRGKNHLLVMSDLEIACMESV